MKIQGLLLLAALGLGGTGSGAWGSPMVFLTDLGNFENPPTGSSGTGFASVTLDTAAHTLTIDMFFSGLTGTVTAAHIHCCVAPPGNVGVATVTPTFTGFPLGVTSGSYFHIFDTTQTTGTFNGAFVTANGGTAAGAEAKLLEGLLAGQAYFNIHTSQFAGGEIRGFFTETPEPATFGLVSVALAAGALIRRRRGV